VECIRLIFGLGNGLLSTMSALGSRLAMVSTTTLVYWILLY